MSKIPCHGLLRARPLLATFLLLLAPVLALAQSTASLRGAVTDEQNGVVAGAQVGLRNLATGEERITVSDGAGNFQLPSLPVGTYRLEVKATGFKTVKIGEVRLGVAQNALQNVKLAVGGITEEVSVIGGAPVIDAGTTSVGQTIDGRTVQEIPLNGRHFVDLALLIPGTVTPPQAGFLTAPLRGQGSFAFNSAGNREDTVNFMINGINLNDQVQNQITFQPSINTVDEFKVDNSTLSAEYGVSSGAVVNIATKSGSNDLHGELFEFYRNQALDARNAFNTPPARQSPFDRNQFGLNLGGPITKNQTFFFLSYEALRQRQGLDINGGVLRDDERAAVTDPVSQSLLALIPAANATGSRGEGRFIGSATAPVDIDQGTGDLSSQLGRDDRIHAYYAYQRDKRQEPVLQGNTVPGFGDTRSSTRQIGTLNETHVFSPNVANELRLGFNRIHITFDPNAQLAPADFGINNGITDDTALPQITIQSLGLNFGGPAGFPQGRTDTTLALSDTLSYLAGRHSFKLGGEYRRFHNQNFGDNGGTFTYATVADFLAGRGNGFTVQLGEVDSDVTQQAIGLFAQDEFRVVSNLTLELGFRYERNIAPTESQNRFVYFDQATDSLRQLGAAGSRDKIYPNQNNYEPRVGVIWDLAKDGKTVVRAAYAMTSDSPVTNLVTPTAGNPPLATNLVYNGAITMENALSVAGPAGISPASVDPAFQNPRVQAWNVNLQRRLWRDAALQVGYFGSKGDRLRLSINLNQFASGVRPYPRLAADSPILPLTAVGNITEVTSLGYSRYNGLWVSLNQHVRNGVQLSASYTYAKSMDTNSLNSQGVVVQDSTNIAGDYGPSDFDVRHRYVVSAIWDLPFKGNRFAEGWQLALITQGQTGSPVRIVTNLGTFSGVANTGRPDLIGNVQQIGSAGQWFSNSVCDPRVAGSCTASSVFAIPVSADGVFHYGDFGRNAVTGPGFYDTDLSIIKKTKFGRTTLELRAEAFNLFNHPNLGEPGRLAAVGSTSFGVITTTRFPTGDSGSARQIQFAAKLLF